jgi:hypothetical protein
MQVESMNILGPRLVIGIAFRHSKIAIFHEEPAPCSRPSILAWTTPNQNEGLPKSFTVLAGMDGIRLEDI